MKIVISWMCLLAPAPAHLHPHHPVGQVAHAMRALQLHLHLFYKPIAAVVAVAAVAAAPKCRLIIIILWV